ncbi:MAG: SDR family NAD(P)-dependent oxidoreductase [Acholeplasmataceae bacterium]
MDFYGKICIVTGASSGIGLETAKLLLDRGALVYGISLEATEDEPVRSNYMPRYADLSVPGTARRTVEEVYEHFGRVDLYIANAGIAAYGYATDLSDRNTERLFSTNVRAAIEALKALKAYQKDRPFTFVAVSSVMAFWPLPGYATYAATKAALAAFIKGFSYECEKNQKLKIVYPVATATNFFSVAGQEHASAMVQTPEHVARRIVRGINKKGRDIHPSRLFRIAYRIAPFVLANYAKREKRLLEATRKGTT